MKITIGYEKPAFLLDIIAAAYFYYLSKAKTNVNNLTPEFCELLCEII